MGLLEAKAAWLLSPSCTKDWAKQAHLFLSSCERLEILTVISAYTDIMQIVDRRTVVGTRLLDASPCPQWPCKCCCQAEAYVPTPCGQQEHCISKISMSTVDGGHLAALYTPCALGINSTLGAEMLGGARFPASAVMVSCQGSQWRTIVSRDPCMKPERVVPICRGL